MSHPGNRSGAGDFGAPLVVQLSPMVGDVLRQQAFLMATEPAELVERLLMRGLHQQRIDEVISELFPGDSRQAATEEASITANLEASALLVALSGASSGPGQAASAGAQARDAVERARRHD